MKFALRWLGRCALGLGLVLGLGLGLVGSAQAALQVNDWVLSDRSVAVLAAAARSRDPKASPPQIMAAIVEDRVLGQHALERFGDIALFDDARVGFSLQTSSEATLIGTLERALHDELAAALQPDGGRRFVVRRPALNRQRLTAALGTGQALRLDDQLDLAHEAALARVVLIEYRFDASARPDRITLRDVWQRLDVQGRAVVRALDADFVERQAMSILRAQFVRHGAQARGGLTSGDLDQLQALMADHERRVALIRLLGASGDPHYLSPEIDRLRQAVQPKEVQAYYAQHLDQFQRIDRVLARHIRCPEEACAHAVHDALAQGESFDGVARRVMPDAAALPDGQAGLMGVAGWVDARQVRGQWLNQLALAQPPGPASEPIREPETTGHAPGWQVVQVQQRVMGLHEADSETVRFAATEAIARERAVTQFAALRQQLLDAAHVDTMAAEVRP